MSPCSLLTKHDLESGRSRCKTAKQNYKIQRATLKLRAVCSPASEMKPEDGFEIKSNRIKVLTNEAPADMFALGFTSKKKRGGNHR